MDFNIEVRKKQLENLDQFISSSKNKVQCILDCLGWTAEKVTQHNVLMTCPVNPVHRVPDKNMKEHVEKCSLRSEGYNSNELFLSEPNNTPGISLKIDDHKISEILATKASTDSLNNTTGTSRNDCIPKTSDRLMTTYTSEERLELYNYVAKYTTGPPKPPEFNITQSRHSNAELSYEELKLADRDARRRRAKYRHVSTNRKNHIEVLREVIDSQMEQYKDWISERSKSSRRLSRASSKEKTEKSSNSIRNEKGNESDRSFNGSYCREKRKRSKDRDRKETKRRSSDYKHHKDRSRSSPYSKGNDHHHDRHSRSHKKH